MESLYTLLDQTALDEAKVAVRLTAAVLLGAIIGWEREVQNRPAGLRTHMLVCLASCTFAIVTLELVAWAQLQGVTSDPVRAIEAVTAGVAFLAAGTIIQSRGHVTGLTTGASLWLAGAIGVATGTGMYTLAFMVTILALIVLSWLRWLSDSIGSSEDSATTNGRLIAAPSEPEARPTVSSRQTKMEAVMPAKSKAQQKAAGAALSAKRGETPAKELKGASKQMMKSMTEKELKELAKTKTKTKNLPDHKTST